MRKVLMIFTLMCMFSYGTANIAFAEEPIWEEFRNLSFNLYTASLVDPGKAQTIFVYNDRKIYYSTDYCISWRSAGEFDKIRNLTSDDYIYLLKDSSSKSNSIYRFNNGNWEKTITLPAYTERYVKLSNNIIVAGTLSGGVWNVYRSQDDGDNWSITGLQGGSVLGRDREGSVVFTYSPVKSTVAYSTDGGVTWEYASNYFPGNTVKFFVSPRFKSDKTLFALITGDRVFRSSNGGKSFGESDFEGFGLGPVKDILYSSSGGVVFAACEKGILKSNNGGLTWDIYYTTPKEIKINNFSEIPDGLLIGSDLGLFRLANKTQSPYLESYFYIGDRVCKINGKTIRMEVAPYIKENRTFIPLRYLSYALGLTDQDISWDEDTKTVTLQKDNTLMKLNLESSELIVNNTRAEMDVKPEILDDRIMLPARWVVVNFSSQTIWDDLTRTLYVRTQSKQ